MKVKKGKTEGRKDYSKAKDDVKSNLTQSLKTKSKKRKWKKLERRQQKLEELEESLMAEDELESTLETTLTEVMEVEEETPTSRKDGKKRKIPKIRRAATTENVEDNFLIVPWASRAEWDTVCTYFHEGSYRDVIGRIAVWQKRVPTLPVGVEASLFLLEALVYDQKFFKNRNGGEEKSPFTEDQARSLYSLAIIRYLNHVSHLATVSLGESSNRLTRELAAIVDTPEWIVALRNDVSHGPTAPSLEVLRMAGNFILHWLKDKYWKLTEETQVIDSCASDPFTITGSVNENVSVEITQLTAAFIAARIYKLRGLQSISDPDILKYLQSNVSVVKAKMAIAFFKSSLSGFLLSHPSEFCTIVSQELIPSFEFYDDFYSIFRKESQSSEYNDELVFKKFSGLWLPIIKMLESKGKLLSVLSNLCSAVIHPENENMSILIAKWIDRLLEIIEVSGKRYTKQLTSLLRVLIKHPNKSMEIFLERMFRLTEPRLGSDVIQQLSTLVSIWLDEQVISKKRRKQHEDDFFTLDKIENNVNVNGTQNPAETGEISCPKPSSSTTRCVNQISWTPDQRGEEFWRNIPLGARV